MRKEEHKKMLPRMSQARKKTLIDTIDEAKKTSYLVKEYIHFRIAHGLTRTEVADLLDVHVSRIIDIETGSRIPSVRFLAQLAYAVGGKLDIVIPDKTTHQYEEAYGLDINYEDDNSKRPVR